MAKTKIKANQTWLHNPSGGIYQVVCKSQIKIPHVGWFKSVTYKNPKTGKTYTRFIEDFENKFTLQNKSNQVDTNTEI